MGQGRALPVAVEDARDLLDVERLAGLVRKEPLRFSPPQPQRFFLQPAEVTGDALEEAEQLGDGADAVDTGGVVAQFPVQSGGDGALLAWHAVGSVQPSAVECPACRAVYEVDDETPELPVCPACGVADTWEARQGTRFRVLIGEIDGCASLGELALVGKRLYGFALVPEQAGVAWSHYRLRRAALEAAIALGAAARALVARVERAGDGELARLGTRLYQLQHTGAVSITASEWRRIWGVYHARRRQRVA